MKAKLICYDLSKISQIKKVEVKRALFGYTEYSNNAKYTYNRKGILSDIPNLRLTRAVIIIPNKEENKVINVIKRYRGEYKSFNIEVNKSMLH